MNSEVEQVLVALMAQATSSAGNTTGVYSSMDSRVRWWIWPGREVGRGHAAVLFDLGEPAVDAEFAPSIRVTPLLRMAVLAGRPARRCRPESRCP